MAQTTLGASFGLGFVIIAFHPSPHRVFRRLLSFSHDFAKQGNTNKFDARVKLP